MIVPGSVNPLLMAGGTDPLDEFGVIARSLRFRSSAGATMRRTMTATGNRTTLVAAAWVKRAVLGGTAQLFSAPVTVGSTEHQMRFEPTNELSFWDSSGGGALLKTSAVYRDTGEFMQVIFAIDTTQAAQANRGFIIVNGVAAPLQNSAFALNQNTAFNLSGNPEGVGNFASLTGGSIDGYMAWAAIIDGYPTGINSGNWSAANIAALFGVQHPITRQWRPKTRAALKALVDAGGPCSFFLPFDDPTTTTTLAADASSKGNNFTAANISLTAGTTYDSMLDSPTNCFATLNPLNNLTVGGGSPSAATEGNLGVTDTGVGSGSFIPSTIIAAGKIYMESTVTLAGTANVNLGLMPASLSRVWASANSVYAGIYGSGTSGIFVNGSLAQTLSNWSSGDVCSMAVDLVNWSIQFYRNGATYGTAVSITPNLDYVIAGFATRDGSGLSSWQYVNFGQQPWDSRTASIRTPLFASGFLPLSTKNLPKPTNSAAINPATAFVAVTDTGANVQTTLASARANFGANYIEIFKRRDASEGWRWRFSDDVANYLDSSSAAAKAAFPSLTVGGNYVGYGLKVSAMNGIATGRLSHVNGVADTVTDGLGIARKLVILKNEATGSWYVFHPDLTVGQLLYLEQIAAATTDNSINTVTSTGFSVAASLSTGTFRWIAFAETSPFLRLFKQTGNGSADGLFTSVGHLPNLFLFKITSTTGNWQELDSARSLYNVAGNILSLNLPDAEITGTNAMDAVSNGQKFRQATYGNNSGQNYVGMSIAAFPFRYANAR